MSDPSDLNPADLPPADNHNDNAVVVEASADPRIDKVMPHIQAAARALGFDIVRVRFLGNARPVLQIMAERSDGTMIIEDCARLSREISAHLDVADPIAGAYTLEVSSPGIDRPLTRRKDFVRWAGHTAKVELSIALNNRKRFRGRLLGFVDVPPRVHLHDESVGEVLLTPEHVRTASLVLTDDLLKAVNHGKDLHGITADDVEFTHPDKEADHVV